MVHNMTQLKADTQYMYDAGANGSNMSQCLTMEYRDNIPALQA